MVYLLINKQVTDTAGNIIPAGAIVSWNSLFPHATDNINYAIFCYTSLANYQGGKSPVVISQITNYNYTKTCTKEEFAGLDAAAGCFNTIADWLKTYLISTGQFVDADLTVVVDAN